MTTLERSGARDVNETRPRPAPHLRFQLTDGADPLYSRGLPIVFKNTLAEGFGYEGRPLQAGWVVATK